MITLSVQVSRVCMSTQNRWLPYMLVFELWPTLVIKEDDSSESTGWRSAGRQIPLPLYSPSQMMATVVFSGHHSLCGLRYRQLKFGPFPKGLWPIVPRNRDLPPAKQKHAISSWSSGPGVLALRWWIEQLRFPIFIRTLSLQGNPRAEFCGTPHFTSHHRIAQRGKLKA